VRNTGAREGSTVVQVYALDASEPADRQVWHLLGFQRVALAPGTTSATDVACDALAISRRDPATRSWAIADGDWQVVAALHAHDPGATAGVGLPTIGAVPASGGPA
jgi:beta-glucosidase